MKSVGLTGLGVATVAALALNAPAMAGDAVEDRLAVAEKRVKYLEQRVASQDQVIAEKGSEEDGWFNSVEIGGAIEVQLASTNAAGEDGTIAGELATAELGIAAAINDEWGGEIVVENDDGTIALADAFLTYEPAGAGFSATAGDTGVPFGVYDTNLISDPLPKSIGDTGGASLALSGETGPANWSLFALNADQFADIFGVAAGFAVEGGEATFGASVSWINDLSGSEVALEAMGMAASANVSLGPASAIVEYVTAFDAQDSQAEPSAWSIEGAYGLALGDTEATLAVGYSATSDGDAAGLAETLMLLGISVGVWENVGVSLEWAREDNATDTVTALLAAEF